MDGIKYYPVIDCDTDGLEKAALFPTSSRDIVSMTHKVWLEEAVPGCYRLCVKTPGEKSVAGAFSIRCPKCGDWLEQIGAKTNETRLGLYACSSCRKGG